MILTWCKRGGLRGYVVTQSLAWDIGKKGSGWRLIVPVGREFESSVPRWLWWVLSPDDPRFLKFAAIHDMLLEEGYRPFFAASAWFDAALSEGAPKGRTFVFAICVTVFTVTKLLFRRRA